MIEEKVKRSRKAQQNREAGVEAQKLPLPHHAPAASAQSALEEWHAGESVRHQQFGEGRIKKVEGENLLIKFRAAGMKKVRASYVQHTAR